MREDRITVLHSDVPNSHTYRTNRKVRKAGFFHGAGAQKFISFFFLTTQNLFHNLEMNYS